MFSPVFMDSAARDASEARRLLWLAFWLMLASIGIGVPRDPSWHTARPPDDVLPPPHLLVTTTSMLTVTAYVYLLISARLRAAFGQSFAIRGVPFAVPGPLVLVGAGLLLLLLGALLDGVWH